MGSRILVTVFGLTLAVFGLPLDETELSTEGSFRRSTCATQRDAAIAAYRRLAEKRKTDNIALSPIDALATLSGMYAYYNEVKLKEFFDSFETDADPTTVVEKYQKILKAFTNQRNIGLSFDIITAHRYGCSRFDYNVTLPTNGIGNRDNEVTFTSIEKAFPALESWYRDMHIDVNFDTAEFGGQTCDVSIGGSSFRHSWLKHNRCVFQSQFFLKDGTVMNDVKYTRIRHRGSYGMLPGLNARYIELDWHGHPEFDYLYRLYIILPDAVDGLAELEARITESTIRRMVRTSVDDIYVELTLPEISVTRKYHLLPIMKKVSEAVKPHQIYDAVSVAKFDAFRATAVNCSSRQGRPHYPHDPVFIANHPFLMVVVNYGQTTYRCPMVVGMLGYRVAEQGRY